MKAYVVLSVLALMLLAVPAGALASGGETYTYISKQDGYLAGTAVLNGTFLIAGSTHVWQFKNGSFTSVYNSTDKVITDIMDYGDYVYIAEAELYERYSGSVYDGDGNTGAQGGSYNNGYDNDTNNSGTTTLNQTVPSPPQQLAGDYDSTGAMVHLVWYAPQYDGNLTLSEYHIYRGTTRGHESYYATVPAGGDTIYYNDTNVQAGQTYYYYVTALNSKGESDPSNEIYVYVSGSGGGGGATVEIASSDTTNENAGYNATNFTIVKLDKNFNVVGTYVLQNVMVYEGALQLMHAAQLFGQNGNIYLAISGEDADNTVNYTTQIYQLSGGQFTQKLSISQYISEIVADNTYFYMRNQNKEIEVYDSTFTLKYSKSGISGNADQYEAMRADAGTLYIAGSSYGTDGQWHAMYLVVDSSLSTVQYYRTWNATGEFAAIDRYANHTAMSDPSGRLYQFQNPNIVYSGRTDPSYVKDLNAGTYVDISNSFLHVGYLRMYSDANDSTYHYVWGGYYQTWDGHMYMFITLSDRPNNWVDLRGVGGWLVAAYESYTDWFVAGAVIVLFIAAMVYIDMRDRHKKHRRWKL